MLEKMLGNNTTVVNSNKRASRAIATLREIWAAEPLRTQGDIHTLLTNLSWRWPLRIYTKEQVETKSIALGEWLRENLRVRGSEEVKL